MKTYRTSCDECGWQSSRCKTAKVAAYALTRHSCDKQRAKDAAARRAREREAAVDRTPQPCTHKRTTHQHGTHACFVLDRCKCPPCNAANTDYESTRRKLHAYGRWDGYTDAQPARDHLTALRAQGMGLRTVSKRTGVSESTLGKIIYGDPARGQQPSKRIRPATEAKILAVTATVHDLADGAKIDGTGTRRRLQALVCIGWSQSRLAPLMGMTLANFNKMITGQRGKVEVGTARSAARLFEQLWNTPPTHRTNYEASGALRSKRYALQRGWVPPMSWDDDQIDNPAARPHSGNRVRATSSTPDDVAWLLEQDPWTTRREIADRLRTSVNTLEVALSRAGRRDLLDQLVRNTQAAS